MHLRVQTASNFNGHLVDTAAARPRSHFGTGLGASPKTGFGMEFVSPIFGVQRTKRIPPGTNGAVRVALGRSAQFARRGCCGLCPWAASGGLPSCGPCGRAPVIQSAWSRVKGCRPGSPEPSPAEGLFRGPYAIRTEQSREKSCVQQQFASQMESRTTFERPSEADGE